MGSDRIGLASEATLQGLAEMVVAAFAKHFHFLFR